MYGTFLLDSVIMRDENPNVLEKILKTIDKPNDKRLELFEEINGYSFKRIGYSLPQALHQDQKNEFPMGMRRDGIDIAQMNQNLK
jgi:hypothetical protein